LQDSQEFQTLKSFWGVWGVGAHTARQWYFDRGWRSLDDIIEGGWDSLSRVQQIGIKYYEEFNEHKIPRSEVEEIGRIVGDASQEVAPGTVYEICGGYYFFHGVLIIVFVEGSLSQETLTSLYRIPNRTQHRTSVLDWSKFLKNEE